MSVRLPTDQNFDRDIIRGLLQDLPDLDVLRVRDVGLAEAGDPLILEWCAQQGRVLLTHDAKTMPGYVYERIRQEKPVPGVVVVLRRIPVGRAVELLLLMLGASLESEWEGQVRYLPL